MEGVIYTLFPKGYGFIQSGTNRADVFLHSTELINVKFGQLSIGDRVSYEVEQTEQGKRAKNVRLIQQHTPGD